MNLSLAGGTDDASKMNGIATRRLRRIGFRTRSSSAADKADLIDTK